MINIKFFHDFSSNLKRRSKNDTSQNQQENGALSSSFSSTFNYQIQEPYLIFFSLILILKKTSLLKVIGRVLFKILFRAAFSKFRNFLIKNFPRGNPKNRIMKTKRQSHVSYLKSQRN